MKQVVRNTLSETIAVMGKSIPENMDRLLDAADSLARALTSGHKILIFGNGSSAADAQHIAAEFVNRFQVERPPLAAVALSTDTSILTSIGNDYSFDEIFSKQISAIGRPHDVAWGISTSGHSKNVVLGMIAARDAGLFTLGMTGRGGQIKDVADVTLSVPSDVTARIQETHIVFGHVVCDLVDRILFPERFDAP
ncbi:D-sedoheptulose 7-phosphate isomerase (EC [Olavius algarvensis associated proteobacterium Delta 3]|nr:D-sedoheptulose 7-phosphate isomerase (EC [Olavius algarvensis associated proteobacterium Delta 3]